MSNQTIDGVSRESLELALGFLDGYGHEGYQRVIADELRALLDAPAKSMAIVPYDLLNTACNGFVQEQGHAINELRELLSNLKADLYVESPSSVLDSADGADNFERDSNIGGKPAIAQPQPTPVAAVTYQQVFKAYEYAEAHPHKYLRGTTNWCAAVAYALNAKKPLTAVKGYPGA